MVGITTLEAANRFLAGYWVSVLEPALRGRARDFTVRFKKRYWQIPAGKARGLRPGAEVCVEHRLCGDIHMRIGQCYLDVES